MSHPISSGATHDHIAARLFRLSLGVFFIGGFVASSVSLLVPRLRLAWGLNYSEAGAIQFASFSSYLLFAAPVAAFVARRGYMRANGVGLAVMAIGCVLLIAGLGGRQYSGVLMSLTCIATGATFLQIAGNNVMTVVGDPRRAAVRMNLLQGFNSLGTVVGPLIGASTLIATAPGGRTGSSLPALSFGFAAFVLAVLAFAFLRNRNLLSGLGPDAGASLSDGWRSALRDRRLQGGAMAIFAYVGAEVTIGALLTDYLMTSHAGAWQPVVAARSVALYWGGAMVGRFAGAALLRHISPARLLAWAAASAVGLVLIAMMGHGWLAAGALLSVGLFNSIMYPTIYVIALPPQADRAPVGGMVLCIAVVGGAIIPLLTGLLADRFGLIPALLLPGLCYLPVLAFALRHHAPKELALTISS
ncbi:MFS transporter [Sphingomonas sanguinis]|uniref:MFS transporter n=1 Tax=Sphingomonas sanguinis TaxID=33051 RepID=UPI001C56D2FE|nr:MFS transporter [Sphingomonas sanguinis]QXT35667.1 MFS transporter [Sphingomonas sanguinis]